jgi:hypothetical protein
VSDESIFVTGVAVHVLPRKGSDQSKRLGIQCHSGWAIELEMYVLYCTGECVGMRRACDDVICRDNTGNASDSVCNPVTGGGGCTIVKEVIVVRVSL